MTDFSRMTDAELRAHLQSQPGRISAATDEAACRFCNTAPLEELQRTVQNTEAMTLLVQSYINDIEKHVGDIQDYLQRALK